MEEIMKGRWDATGYFRKLTESNVLAREYGFRFFVVSDLQGFEDAVNSIQDTRAFVCVSDISDGVMDLNNTPHIRQTKTVFMAMRHSVQAPDWAQLRERCFDVMREIFRQFMSAFAKEKTSIEQGRIFFEPKVSFSEINKYFISGCACCYFQIAVTGYSDLVYRKEEWL